MGTLGHSEERGRSATMAGEYLRLSLVLFLIVMLGACGAKDVQAIAGEYVYTATNAYNRYITLGDSIVIESDVQAYCVVDGVIYGVRRPSRRPDVEDVGAASSVFAINVSTGVVTQDVSLTLEYWEALTDDRAQVLAVLREL